LTGLAMTSEGDCSAYDKEGSYRFKWWRNKSNVISS